MHRLGVLILALIAAMPSPLSAETLHGVVVGVSDRRRC